MAAVRFKVYSIKEVNTYLTSVIFHFPHKNTVHHLFFLIL